MSLDKVENFMKFHFYYNSVTTTWKRNEKRSSTSVKMEIKNILVWCVQRHAEKEWSYGEDSRLQLQKAELIPCPVEYYIYHAGLIQKPLRIEGAYISSRKECNFGFHHSSPCPGASSFIRRKWKH